MEIDFHLLPLRDRNIGKILFQINFLPESHLVVICRDHFIFVQHSGSFLQPGEGCDIFIDADVLSLPGVRGQRARRRGCHRDSHDCAEYAGQHPFRQVFYTHACCPPCNEKMPVSCSFHLRCFLCFHGDLLSGMGINTPLITPEKRSFRKPPAAGKGGREHRVKAGHIGASSGQAYFLFEKRFLAISLSWIP